MLEGTYLSLVESSVYTRRFERVKVSIPAEVHIVLPRMAGIRTKQCKVVDLSLDGAGLLFNETIGLPKHYYITIPGFGDRIGCAEVHRADIRVGIKFLQLLDEWRFNAYVGADLRGSRSAVPVRQPVPGMTSFR